MEQADGGEALRERVSHGTRQRNLPLNKPVADPIRIVVDYSASGELVIKQALSNLDGLRDRVGRLAAAGPLSSRAMRTIGEDAERVANAYHGKLSSAFGLARNEANHLFESIDRFGHRAFYGLLGVTAAVSAGMFGLGRSFIQVNEDFAGLEITVKSALQSVQAARKIRDEVAAITAESPLPFKDLGEATRNIITMPFSRNKIAGQLSAGTLSDQQGFFRQSIKLIEQMVAFRPDKDAKDAMFSIREAMSGQFRSLIRRFDIPSTALSSASGVSVKELTTDPGKTFEALRTFFGNIITPEAINELIRQPKFLFQNAIEQVFHIPLLKIGDETYSVLVDNLTSLYNRITRFVQTKFDGFAKKIGGSLLSIFSTLSKAGETTAESLMSRVGYGKSDRPGETGFERGATMVQDAVASLSRSLPDLLKKTGDFFNRVYPLIERFGKIVFFLAEQFLRFVDFSPMLAALTLFFRSAITSVMASVLESAAGRIINGGLITAASARAASSAPDFTGLRKEAVTLAGYSASKLPGGAVPVKLSDPDRDALAAKLAARFYSPPTGILDPRRISSDPYYRGGAFSVGSAKAVFDAAGNAVVPLKALSDQAKALASAVDFHAPTSTYGIKASASKAEVGHIETMLGKSPGAYRPGIFLPPEMNSLMAGYKAQIAQAELELLAHRASVSRADREVSKVKGRVLDAKTAALSPGSVLDESRAFLKGTGATLAVEAKAMFAPMAAIAGLSAGIQAFSDLLDDNLRLRKGRLASEGEALNSQLGGGFAAREQNLVVAQQRSTQFAEALESHNQGRLLKGLPAQESAPTQFNLTTFGGSRISVPVTGGMGGGYTAAAVYDDLSKKTVSLSLNSQAIAMRASKTFSDLEKMISWIKGGKEGDLTNLVTMPELSLSANTGKEKVAEVAKALFSNLEALTGQTAARLDALKEVLDPVHFKASPTALSGDLDAFIEGLRVKSGGLVGSLAEKEFYSSKGTPGTPGSSKGTLGDITMRLSGIQSDTGEAISALYEKFDESVRENSRPLFGAEDSLSKLQVLTENNLRLKESLLSDLADPEFITRFGLGLTAHTKRLQNLLDTLRANKPAMSTTQGKELESFLKEAMSKALQGLATAEEAVVKRVEDSLSANSDSATKALLVGMSQFESLRLTADPEKLKASISKVVATYNKQSPLGLGLDQESILSAYSSAIPTGGLFGEARDNDVRDSAHKFVSAQETLLAEINKGQELLKRNLDDLTSALPLPPYLQADNDWTYSNAWQVRRYGAEKVSNYNRVKADFFNRGNLAETFSSNALTGRTRLRKADADAAGELEFKATQQARDSLPQFFHRLPTLETGAAGQHAIGELRNALEVLKFDGLLKNLGSLDVFLKDASGPDHFAVMAEKYREMDRLLPALNVELQKQLDAQRAGGLVEEAKKTQAALQKNLVEQEKSLAATISYFTQGMAQEIEQTSLGIGDSFARSGFVKQLERVGGLLPGVDFSGLEGKLSASIADQTLPTEQGQQAQEAARFARVQLFGALSGSLSEEVSRLESALEKEIEYGPEHEALVQQLETARRFAGSFASEALKRTNDLQRVFLTEQLLRADQARKTAQGALQSDLEASLNVRPSQIGQFQLADLEKHVREAGLEDQVDFKNFLKDSVGPENLSPLLDKQKDLESIFLRLGASFEKLAQESDQAAREFAKTVIPKGYIDVGNGRIYNPNVGEFGHEMNQADVLPDFSERDRRRGLAGGLYSRAESLRREQEEVRGTGMTDSFSRGFRGVTERFREEAQNFKSIGADIASSLQTNLGGAFADFITGTKSAKEAFADFGKSILNEVARIFANKAAAQLIGFATQAVFGIFGGGAPTGTTTTATQSSAPGVYAPYAAGGFIKGGSGIRDDVPALLMGGEYVVRRTAVERYGEEFLNALNQSRLQIEPDGSNAGFAASVQQKPLADSVMPRRLVSEALDSAIAARATGGMIFGGSGIRDDVPAMLMGGEFVVRRAAVERYGQDFMEALNTGAVIHRAEGGMIPRASGSPAWVAGPDASLTEPAHVSAPVSNVDASNGDSHVNITINENGTVEESHKGQKQGQFGDNKEFARMLKSAVLEVMNTQRRPGGAWRNA